MAAEGLQLYFGQQGRFDQVYLAVRGDNHGALHVGKRPQHGRAHAGRPDGVVAAVGERARASDEGAYGNRGAQLLLHRMRSDIRKGHWRGAGLRLLVLTSDGEPDGENRPDQKHHGELRLRQSEPSDRQRRTGGDICRERQHHLDGSGRDVHLRQEFKTVSGDGGGAHSRVRRGSTRADGARPSPTTEATRG